MLPKVPDIHLTIRISPTQTNIIRNNPYLKYGITSNILDIIPHKQYITDHNNKDSTGCECSWPGRPILVNANIKPTKQKQLHTTIYQKQHN